MLSSSRLPKPHQMVPAQIPRKQGHAVKIFLPDRDYSVQRAHMTRGWEAGPPRNRKKEKEKRQRRPFTLVAEYIYMAPRLRLHSYPKSLPIPTPQLLHSYISSHSYIHSLIPTHTFTPTRTCIPIPTCIPTPACIPTPTCIATGHSYMYYPTLYYPHSPCLRPLNGSPGIQG